MALALLVCTACGDDGPSAPAALHDGGTADAGAGCPAGTRVDGDACIEPGVESCGAGFVADDARGCVAKLPAEPCAPGTLAVPGDVSCRPVAPCEGGPWGAAPVDGATQFVDAAYGGDSDGTEAKPWTTIGDAVAHAAAGALVAITTGTYSEDLDLGGKPAVLWGRCPGEVTIGGAGGQAATILIRGGADATELHDLSITSGVMGLAISGAVDVKADRLWIHDTGGRGVDVEDTFGPAALSLERSLVENATGVGVFALGGEVVVLASAVRGTRAGNAMGRGVALRGTASSRVEGSLVDGNRDHGILASGAQARIVATLVRNTLPDAAGKYGRGIGIKPDDDSGASSDVEIRSSVVEGSHDVGITVIGSHAVIDATVVRDGRWTPSPESLGAGIVVQDDQPTGASSSLSLSGSVVERSRYAALSVLASDADVRSTILRDTAPIADGHYGRGVVAFHDAQLDRASTVTLDGCRVERSTEAAVFAEGSTLTVRGTLVRETAARIDGKIGRGINVQSRPDFSLPGKLVVERSQVIASHGVGIFVEGSDATLTDVDIEDTLPEPVGLFGDGILIATFPKGPVASATVTRTRVAQSARAGLSVFAAKAVLEDDVFECNPIHLAGERVDGVGNAQLVDEGGNACGCDGKTVACGSLSAGLEPPPAVP